MNEVERAEGAFYGLAMGEALGRPAEGAKPGAVKSAYGVLRDYADSEKILPIEKIYKWTMPGLYASGSQQAIALLDSLVQDRGFTPEKFAERLVALSVGSEFQFGVYRNSGRNFRLCVTELKQGRQWTETGRDSAGNAAAVRVAPIGVYFREHEERLVDAAIRASLITHKNPIAISAAVSVALFVAFAINDEEIISASPAKLLEYLATRTHNAEKTLRERYSDYLTGEWRETLHFFSETLLGLSQEADRGAAKAGEWIAKNADAVSSNTVTRPTLGVAPASVAFSIYLAATHKSDFEKALTTAVNSGGEAASIGAMTGAMAGAISGASAIPERWMKNLANRKQLKVRAESLAAGKWFKSKAEDLYQMEYGLTDREHRDRLARMKKLGVDFPEKSSSMKLSEPEPINEKFDVKKYRRQQEKMKRWMKYAPPESWK